MTPVEGDQPRVHRLEEEILEGLQVEQVTVLGLELGARRPELLGEAAGDDRDREEGPGVEEDRQQLERARLVRRVEEDAQREHGPGEHDACVQDARDGRDREPAGPRQENARAGHQEHVEEREDRAGAAGGEHHGGDERRVEQTDQPRDPARMRERREEEQGDRGSDRDEEGEDQDRHLALHEAGRHEGPEREEQGGEPEPRPGEPAQEPADVERLHYFIKVTSLKIGRYMATTRPPTTMPRNTIMIGSSSDVSAPTAVSTSSS